MKTSILMALLFLSPCLHATGVSGQVVNTSGQGVAGVTVHISGNGVSNSLITSATGLFSFTVPAGTYSISFRPSTATLAPRRLEGLAISGVSFNVGVVTLLPGFILTGNLASASGAALANADTDTFDEITGEKLYTPNDNTNNQGVFTVVVPASTYKVRGNPPAGMLLVAQEIHGVVVNGFTNVGTIVLQPGVQLTGTVVSSQTLLPVVQLDIDVDNLATGQRIPTPGDKTNSAGIFSVVVPLGTYRVSFDPPPGAPLLGRRIPNVVVSGTTNMGTVTVDPGLLLSGTVLDAAANPVDNINVDILTSPGDLKIYTPNDCSDASGNFTVAVPPGTYTVVLRPLFTSGFAGLRSSPLTVSGNTSVGNLTLALGVPLSGTVTGWNGGPETEALVEVIDPPTGEVQITPGNLTDLNGHYQMLVVPGTYNLAVTPINLSFSKEALISGIAVNAATTTNIQLVIVRVAAWMGPTSLPPVTASGTVPVNLGFYNPFTNGISMNLSLVLKGPTGGETVLVPPVTLNIPPQQLFLLLGLPISLPPTNPAFSGLPYEIEFRITNTATGLLEDRDHVRFVIL